MTMPAVPADSLHAGLLPARPGLGRWLLDHVEEALGGIAFVGMTAIVFLNVVLRYVFNDPIPGADELATLAFTWAVFLGVSAGVRLRLHLGIEFAVRWLPPRGQVAAGLAVTLLVAVFAVLLGVYGAKLMSVAQFKRTPVLQWSYVWVYLAIPVAAALMLVRLGAIAAGQVRALAGGTR